MGDAAQHAIAGARLRTEEEAAFAHHLLARLHPVQEPGQCPDWAFMFVRAVGLGPFPGVLAIGIAYGGMLGKVYSEILEGVNPRPLETLHAAGATRAGVVAYGLVPQALPGVIAYTLYRWECAIRASAVLGFVGAGGLGQQIELSMRMFQFDELVTLLAMLFTLVATVDVVSGRIRARVT